MSLDYDEGALGGLDTELIPNLDLSYVKADDSEGFVHKRVTEASIVIVISCRSKSLWPLYV